MATLTKGNVIVEDIKIGDVHYEFEYNIGIKSKVLTLPKQNNDGIWEWTSENLISGEIIRYTVNPKFSGDYSINLYDYDAYDVTIYI